MCLSFGILSVIFLIINFVGSLLSTNTFGMFGVFYVLRILTLVCVVNRMSLSSNTITVIKTFGLAA